MSLLLIASAYLDEEEEFSFETESNNVIEQEAKAPQDSNSSNGVDCASFEIKSRRSKRRKVICAPEVGQKPDIPQPTLNDCKNEVELKAIQTCSICNSSFEDGRFFEHLATAHNSPAKKTNQQQLNSSTVPILEEIRASKLKRKYSSRRTSIQENQKRQKKAPRRQKNVDMESFEEMQAKMTVEESKSPILNLKSCQVKLRKCDDIKTIINRENVAQNKTMKAHKARQGPKSTFNEANKKLGKPHLCSFPGCSKSFVVRCRLQEHYRIHTGEKPFECKVCFKRFRQHSHLAGHKRIHSGEKPFQCRICSKRYNNKSNLTRHERMHKDHILKCPYCPKQYRYSCSLTRHAKQAHGKVWRERTQATARICKENKKQSESPSIEHNNSMNPKEKTTPNKRKQREAMNPKKDSSCKNSVEETKNKMNCSFPNCGKYFPTKQRLKIHNRIHTGEKPYECKVCFKRFNQTCALTIHARIHTGDQPFECKICYKRFRQRPNLTIHLRHHKESKAQVSVVKKKRGNGPRVRKNCKQSEKISTSSKINAKSVEKSTREEKAMKNLRTSKNSKKVYTCLVCPMRCRTMDSIQLHIKNAHGIELSAKFDKKLLLGSSK